MSSVHEMEVDCALTPRFHSVVVETLKTTAERLRRTREALGLTASELCRRIGCRPNRWSQYESGERLITLPVANRLCDEFSLTLDWIYRNDPAGVPYAIAAKMRKGAA